MNAFESAYPHEEVRVHYSYYIHIHTACNPDVKGASVGPLDCHIHWIIASPSPAAPIPSQLKSHSFISSRSSFRTSPSDINLSLGYVDKSLLMQLCISFRFQPEPQLDCWMAAQPQTRDKHRRVFIPSRTRSRNSRQIYQYCTLLKKRRVGRVTSSSVCDSQHCSPDPEELNDLTNIRDWSSSSSGRVLCF